MSLIFTTTRGAGVSRLKCLIYGPPGVGKTSLAGTTGDDSATLILSAEAGLLSLRGRDIAVVEGDSVERLREVYQYLRRGDHPYQWLILDSLSEIAERLLTATKARAKDPRAAYGDTAEQVAGVVKALRDLPLHVVLIAKDQVRQDDLGRVSHAPSFPGRQLAAAIPYDVDLVLAYRCERDRESGQLRRWLQTQPDGVYDAKDRSGALGVEEPPDLKALAAKIAATAKG